MDSPMEDMMKSKCADPELQLDVDIMTLDYLLHKAITCVSENRKSQQGGRISATESLDTTERALASVDTCIEIFHQNHPVDSLPPTTQFRLDLLKFTTLFCRRLFQSSTTPPLSSLTSIRKIHHHRAQKWHRARSSTNLNSEPLPEMNELPLPPDHLQQCRSHVLSKFGVDRPLASSNEDIYGTEAAVSLLDLLPFFMHISAARSQLDADFGVTERWMQLAGEFMLQASLESVLCCGSTGAESVREAFAWGFVSSEHGGDWREIRLEDMEADVDVQLDFAESGLVGAVGAESAAFAREEKIELWDAEEVVNQMFTADEEDDDEEGRVGAFEETAGREIEGWNNVREEYLKLLQPAEGSPLINHLVQTAAEYPLVDFEWKILSYLAALSQSIEAPILVQLERGRLACLDNSVEETNKFKQRVGLHSWIPETAT